MMDYDDFRSVLESSGVDVWSFIDTAIAVACSDYGDELKNRRDGIVERLYASSVSRCRNCDVNRNRLHNGDEVANALVQKEIFHEGKGGGEGSPSTPQSVGRDDDDGDLRFGGLFDDEQVKILSIKEQLEDPDQSEESLVELLQSLADMDITFQALEETDIGRHVNRLRKHSSSDVRRLVKQLVRKWKDLVDEWVKLKPSGEQRSSALIAYGDSPQQKVAHNGHQVPDFTYSPNPHNGSSGSDKNNAESEPKIKPNPRREAPAKPTKSTPSPSSAPSNVYIKQREQKETTIIEVERLASARKRLQENYKEAENAKRQRTIQVMDIHEIPKPKNTFFAAGALCSCPYEDKEGLNDSLQEARAKIKYKRNLQ